jgi:DNA repair exonuclease SbcCD ATPase subunit
MIELHVTYFGQISKFAFETLEEAEKVRQNMSEAIAGNRSYSKNDKQDVFEFYSIGGYASVVLAEVKEVRVLDTDEWRPHWKADEEVRFDRDTEFLIRRKKALEDAGVKEEMTKAEYGI